MRRSRSSSNSRSPEWRAVHYRVEELLYVELEGFRHIRWTPDEPIIHEGRPIVSGMPDLEYSRIRVDDPIVGNTVTLKGRALGDAVVAGGARRQRLADQQWADEVLPHRRTTPRDRRCDIQVRLIPVTVHEL